MICRHMARLIDAWDEISNDLAGQEDFWRGWREKRLAALPKRPELTPSDAAAPPTSPTRECHGVDSTEVSVLCPPQPQISQKKRRR
jgi:hypothetical protein